MKHVLMEEANGGDAGGAAGIGVAAPAAAVAAPAAAPVAAAPSANWFGPSADGDVAAYVAAKGWTGPEAAIASYRHAEKLIGRDPTTLLQMPRADDTEGQRAVFAKLGMPEKADGYKFDLPQGAKMDEARASWARDAFHKAGLTQQQANFLANAEAQHGQAQAAQHAKDYDAYVAHEQGELKQEWSAGFDKKMNQAKAAASAFGVKGEVVDAIESVLGFRETMKFFAGIGEKMGEDGFVTEETRRAGINAVLTPAEAKVQWDQKVLDPNFKAALFDKAHPGHKAAGQEQARMFKLMFPED